MGSRVKLQSSSPLAALMVLMLRSWMRTGTRVPVAVLCQRISLSPTDGPVFDCDVIHGEVGGVARCQVSLDAGGGGSDQAVGLVKSDPSAGELAAPLPGANSFGRAQGCAPQAAHQPLCCDLFTGKQSAPDLLDRDRAGPRFVTLAA